MTALRAALVGCGSVSQRGVLPHLTCEDARAAVHLAAVVDVVAERAAQTAARFEVPAWFDDIDAMLSSVEVDIVLVLTPIQHHFANALAAVTAGKHVYVQKTMTATLEEADQLIAARDRAGVQLVAAPGFDLFPTTHAIRAVVDSGEIGAIGFGYTYAWGFGHEHESVRAGDDALSAINPMWYYRQGAGPLPDVTVYALQLATSVLGTVRRVTALGNKLIPLRRWRDQTIEIEVDDNVVVLMEFENGAIVTGVGSDTAASKRNQWGALSLYGTNGGIEVFDVDPATGYPLSFEVFGGGGWGTFGTSVRERIERIPLSAHPRMVGPHLEIEEGHVYVDIMALVDAVRDGRSAGATADQARHVVEIIECAHRAIASGATQELRTRADSPD